MKSASHISSVLMLVVILLSIEEIFAQDPSEVELIIEMPQHIIRQGIFHGSVSILFKDESTEILRVVSIKMLHQEELLFERHVSRNLSGIKSQWDEYQNLLAEYEYLTEVGGRKEDTDMLRDRLLDLQSEILQGMEIQVVAIDSSQLFGNDFLSGATEIVEIVMEYEYKGKVRTVERIHKIEVLPPYPTIPVPDHLPYIDSYWKFGNLHVHTGYSSVPGYDNNTLSTCDNCGEELESWSGHTNRTAQK